jgi:hypothetical protein
MCDLIFYEALVEGQSRHPECISEIWERDSIRYLTVLSKVKYWLYIYQLANNLNPYDGVYYIMRIDGELHVEDGEEYQCCPTFEEIARKLNFERIGTWLVRR